MKNVKYFFQKLTPVNNADISVYEEAIDFIFVNSDVKNVAISGAYSSGKSSILESYKAKNKKHRFVHVSLARFHIQDQENKESEEFIKDSILEGKILNQIIHQIPAEKIPQSNFRVKKGVSTKNLILSTLYSCLFIGSIAIIIFSNKLTTFVENLPDDWVKSALLVLFSPYGVIKFSIVLAICVAIFIFLLIRAQKNKNVFRKISLQGNEIEIFEEQDDSYFDKYLNDVLYLFENIEADVIVFEDMDRFNASRIFERLREVNTLININRMKENSAYSPLRFFYLLRDDIFVSKDRTKFFDFIIPIVPIIDSSNSYEQICKYLEDSNMLNLFDKSFLQSLSLYIDDMRILKNIFNEFLIYMHRLNTTDLDWNKMLAMIAYKNLFPRDFSELQLLKGFVFEVFDQKYHLIEEAIKSAKKQRDDLLQRIEGVKNETLITLEELTDAFKAKNDRLPRNPYNRSLLPESSQEVMKKNDAEMLIRKQSVQDKLEMNMVRLEAELAQFEDTITLTKAKTFKNLINSDDFFSLCHTNEVGEVTDYKEIKRSEYFALLKFLIRNGYIDETYSDYMTYFYEGSISTNDKKFLRRITDRRGAEYTYALKDPKLIIESPILKENSFEQVETLNFDVFEFLLIHNSTLKYQSYLKILLSQIRKSSNFDFLSRFYETNRARNQLVLIINEQWPDYFSTILEGKLVPTNQILQYSVDTLNFSDDKTLRAVNVSNCLKEYISSSPEYLAIVDPLVDKLVSSFILLGISFDTIDYDVSDKALFDEIYRNNLYSINFENISLMLKNVYRVVNDSDIERKNYTLIQSNKDSPLAKYVADNISLYIDLILDHCSNNITDDESIAICLLNNENIGVEAKERYINFLTTVIVQITHINDLNLWKVLLNRKNVETSTFNLISYYNKNGLDVTLIHYINDVFNEIDFRSIKDDFGVEVAEKLFDDIAVCNHINSDGYKKILLELGYQFNSFEAEGINDEKIRILITEGIFEMNADTLAFVRTKYVKHNLVFIQKYLLEYFALQKPEIFKLDEALEIIKWDIDDFKKIELLKFTNEAISIVGKQYSDVVNSYILVHNFYDEDKPNLYSDYLLYGEKTQIVINALAKEGVKEIVHRNMILNDALLSVLLKSDVVTREVKIMLFRMAIPRINEEDCKIHLDELELPELKGIFTKGSGRRNYEKNEEITELLSIFKANGWIYDYKEDERNIEKYIIVKNIPKNT